MPPYYHIKRRIVPTDGSLIKKKRSKKNISLFITEHQLSNIQRLLQKFHHKNFSDKAIFYPKPCRLLVGYLSISLKPTLNN